MRASIALVTIAAAAAIAFGCNSVLGVNDPHPTGVGGSGGATSATSSSAAGGGASGEDCFNGVDDDGDGDVDCEDSECGAATRAPEVPDDWKLGELLIGETVPIDGTMIQPCDPGYVALNHGGTIMAPPLTCAPCTCPGCMPAGGEATMTPTMVFSPSYTNCAAMKVGAYGAHGVCIEKHGANAHGCVFHVDTSANLNCPAGYDVNRRFQVITGSAAGLLDTRTCSACTCDGSCAPGGGQSMGGYDGVDVVTDWVACCVD